MHRIVVSALVPPTPDARELLESDSLLLVPPGDLPALVERLDGRAPHILLLGEKRHEPLVRQHAALASDRGCHVAWRATHHGPAAILLMANQIAAAGVDAGIAVVIADRLIAETWSGAWTPSVARLEHPEVAVGQHLRSWLPGGDGFVVTFSGPLPEARLVGRASAAEPELRRGDVYGAGIGRIPAAALPDVLTTAGAASTVDLPALALDVRGRVGVDTAVELVALPLEQRMELPPARGRCSVCDALLFSDTCPFCHVRPAVVDPQGVLA
ncbi:hypothetical protein [Cellulomonas wangsupingiae]|uniref:Uncharacterized protein n=1 Tax=Cellulomonas wangsupingiae TaxID=2968085 RepID=A0ABY5K4P2_9CELL|nr:hypothetical protein [Cellulomonas wangsupingiae]MCC2335892.1 hypothetical protein [Cellulomonas wangsupingiae]UUI64117.1 hypothetical protein NP075_13390 [Cellulomonas wangsupingiae]